MNLHNIDPQLERAFLSRIANTDELLLVSDKVRPEYFSDKKLRECVSACLACILNGSEINPVNISRELREMGSKVDALEMAGYIEPGLTETPAAELLEELREVFSRRECEILGRQLVSGTIPDMLGFAQARILEISSDVTSRKSKAISELVIGAVEQLKNRAEARLQGGKPTDIVFSGLAELDKLYPFEVGDLVILAGRPGMGKTSFAKTLSRNMSKMGHPVYFNSVEVSTPRLTSQIIGLEAKLNSNNIRSGKLDIADRKKYADAARTIAGLNITLAETPSLVEMLTDIRKWRIKNPEGIGVIFIDYLQLLSNPIRGGNREQEISATAYALKYLAKELGCVVFPLSQLSRAVETRGGDKKPMLSDLRESGAIEQAADTVIFLYRPEYYGFETDEEGNTTLGLAEVIIGKGRNIGTCSLKTQFVGKYGEFSDWQSINNSFNQNKISMPAQGSMGDVPF